MSRVKIVIEDVNIFNDDDWRPMNNFLIDRLPRFENAFLGHIDRIKR